MLNDFEPIIIDFPAKTDIKIRPLFDIHIGSAQFNEKRFTQFVDDVLADPKCYVVIGGDLMDMGLKNSVTNCYEQTMRPSEQKRYCTELLRPLAAANRILCGTGGNHEHRAVKECDDNPLYDVFAKLDIEDKFRENICFLFVRIGGGDTALCSKHRPCYSVAVTHGAGGGMYIGSGANRMERFGSVIDGLDIIITGHTHKPITFPVAKLVIDPQNKQITTKQFTCVTATSWLDYGGYPVRKMLTPTAFAMQEIYLSGNGKNVRVLQ